jgi:Carboxypeptidase regulatory-like domain/TonB dependent receptor/TonB-dependent Receptor Plug Domain
MKADSLHKCFILGIFVVMALSGKAFGQTPGTGAIIGTVSDPSGRPVAKAAITAIDESTHASRVVASEEQGVFRIALLPPGRYTVSTRAAGFAEQTSRSIEVTVSETTSIAVKLAVASANATVEVDANAELIQSESSTLGRAVSPSSIEALPLANRNYTQILGLSPGVVVSLPDATELGRGTQNVTSNGAKTTSNNIQFNGIDANNLSQNSAASDGEEVGTAIPAPDAIQEFKVQTANYDASFGRGAGANVDLVSRAGSNRFHGSVWEFVRNNIFNANDFFLKLDEQPRPTLKQNQYGASFGGPIRKDKTFFFAAYQGLASSNGEGAKVTTLLPQLGSDRSATTLGAQFCPANHGNAAGYLTNAGGTQVACDGSNINSVALALLNFKLANGALAIPSPQVNLASSDPSQLPIGQSTFAIPASYKENQFTVNLDQMMSASNTLSGRFFYSRAPTSEPFSPNAANLPGWGTDETDHNTMFVLADTHVFSSNLINVARFGYMRFNGLSAVTNPILASDLGTVSPTGAAGPTNPAPGVSIGGLFTTGDAGTGSQWQNTNSFIWQDALSHSRGRHNLRFGAEVKRHEVDVEAPFSSDGLMQISTFDDFLLGLSAEQTGSPIGISNVTNSMGSSGNFRKDERYTDLAGFVQDDFRVTARFTLNAGLRYEVFGPAEEIHGFLPNFNPLIATGAVPVNGSLSGFTLPANFSGPVADGVVKTSTASFWPTSYRDLSPRIGFALKLTGNSDLLLRGGYGIYYDRPSAGFAEGQLGQQPFSLQQLAFFTQNAGATLQVPFSPLLPPASSFPIYQPRFAGGGAFTSGVSPDIRDPYTQEYNLNLQYAFAANYLFELGYVGSHTTHSPASIEFNQALLASPQNPINGTAMNTASNVIQRLPYQGISQGSLFSETGLIANYNSLQASVTRRLAHGFQFLSSYTWSKILDETSGSGGSSVFELWLPTNDQHNPRQAYGLTDFDRDQRVVVNLTWDTPKFQQAPRFTRQLLGGWQLSGIAVVQSGSPITILDSNAGLVYGNFENRAQRTGSNPATSGSLHSRVLNGYLDPNAFTIAPPAPNSSGPGDTDFGNSSVGIVRGPGQHNIDMAVERTFPVKESSSFRFRAEFFNLTNTPQFANPNNGLDFTLGPNGPVNLNPSFGAITSTAANPRIIQFAAKYVF